MEVRNTIALILGELGGLTAAVNCIILFFTLPTQCMPDSACYLYQEVARVWALRLPFVWVSLIASAFLLYQRGKSHKVEEPKEERTGGRPANIPK